MTLDLGAEALVVAAYATGTVVLSLLGLAAEYSSVQLFFAGDRLLAVWFAIMGVVALGFAVNLAREKLLPQMSAQR